MTFAAAGALALRLAPGVTVHRPAHGDRAAADVAGDALGAELRELALAIAGRFDARNGTDSISRATRETLTAEPLVDELVLSPTAVKRTPRSAPVVVESIVELPVVDPVALPAVDEPDGWLDLIEEALREERDTAAVLAAFDERFPVDALTVAQRARRAVVQGDRSADAGDLAAAEAAWRTAEADFAAAGDDEGRQRTRSRLGLALVEAGHVDEGLAMLIDATEALLTSGSAEVRCDAAGRLGFCLTRLDRPDEALVVLDRVAGDLDDVPVRSAAVYLVRRVAALIGAGRVDEALTLAGPATERAREAGVRWILTQIHGVHAACLEQVGRLAEAADQISAAIATSDDPDRIAHLRFVRGNQLARTDRAAEALDDLTETVAGRTATGDDEGAAEARHWLAIAYLRADRLLDAAEVAEEELAHRVRADGAGAAIPVRHLLATIYQRLNQPDEAIAQLDTIGRECALGGNPAGQGQMEQEIADILDRLDRDEAAAQRYRSAAGAFQAAGLALEQLYSRRRQARSTFWAHGPQAAEPLFKEAAELAASLPGTLGPQLVWERAMLDHDAARMLLGARRLDEAAARAHASAEAFRGIDEIGGASDADVLRAEILLTADQPEAAEAAARLALAEVPPGGYTVRIAKALATALERQGRAEEAETVRAEHGVSD
jgi:cellulose synthase operon protein C